MRALAKYALTAFAAAFSAACSGLVDISEPAVVQDLEITASRECLGAPGTRSVRQADGSVLWQAAEEVSVFYGSGSSGGSKLTSNNTEPAGSVKLTGSVQMVGSGKDYWAVYPYSSDNSCDGSSITTVIPPVQTAVAGNFPGNAFPAMAKSKTLGLAFWNLCGGIRFSVSRGDIKSVTFSGNMGEPLAGKVAFVFGEDGRPVVSNILDSKTSVTLQAPDGETLEAGADYYVTLLPGMLGEGFTVSLKTSGMLNGSFSSFNTQTIRRSTFGVIRNIDSGVGEWTLGEPEPEPGATVYGRVQCEGTGVPGVLVSDGDLIVETDANGIYQMPSQKKWEYVFVIIPSGYMVPCQGILPQFHQTTNKAATAPERKDFELVRTVNDNFNLFVLGDMHLARRLEDLSQFSQLARTLNQAISASSDPSYILTLGDMTWDLYWYSNSYQFPQYVNTMNSALSIPFFHTMGNHDNDMNSVGDYSKAFRYSREIAPTFYSFNLGQIHFIVMDNIDYNDVGTGSELRGEYKKNYTAEQMAWLAKDLSYVDPSTPVFITSHAPVSHPSGTSWSNTYMNGADAPGEANMSAFISAVSTHNVNFLSGHTHKLFHRKHSAKFSEHNEGAVCASWWWSGHLTQDIHLCQDGTPGGFAIWRFDGKSFTQSYQAGGHDLNYQFRAYDMNKVKEYITPALGGSHKDFLKFSTAMQNYAANTILVNVWDYDPSWTVKISEDGKQLNVAQVTAYDPLHIAALSAPRCKSASASSTPSFMTDTWPHFFRAVASSATSTVTIEVTDRNGVKYTETMVRPKAFRTADYKNTY